MESLAQIYLNVMQGIWDGNGRNASLPVKNRACTYADRNLLRRFLRRRRRLATTKIDPWKVKYGGGN